MMMAVASLVFTACSSSDDGITGGDGGNGGGANGGSTPTFVGAWYDSALNEYVVYDVNGTFYDRYANIIGAYETSGRWEYNAAGGKMTEYSKLLGQTQFSDFTVKALTDEYFIFSSETTGDMKYEKVVESVSLPLDGTVTVSSPYNAYTPVSSTNSRIATISNGGVIKSEGEKGTAFVALVNPANQCKVWVKVTVGDDCLDQWCDYIPMLGTDYNGMKAFMHDTPKKTSADGLTFAFTNTPTVLNKIEEVTVVLGSKDKKVIEIMLTFPDVVTSTELETYLKSRFFPSSKLGDDYYTNKSNVEKSTVVLYYDKSANTIHYVDAAYMQVPQLPQLPDFTGYMGYTEQQLYDKFGEGLYQGLLPYFAVEDTYVKSVYFHINNNTGKAVALQMDLMENIAESDVKAMLSKKYPYYVGEQDGRYIYRDGDSRESSRWQVAYKPSDCTVIVIDLLNYAN